ncbi:MAG: PAS domain S-box protein, partial [Bacteroidia bacterium]
MNKPNSTSSDSSAFRQQAEELLKTRKQKTVLPNSKAEILKLIFELEVSQIELELQNEELVRTKSYGDDINKSLFQDNHSIILYIDAETGDIKKANAAACLYYGWSNADLCKKNISEINTLSQAEVVIEMQKAKEEKRNHFFFKHRLANGEIRDVEVYSGPVHLNNSILLYSFIHDITERKRTEEVLSASELKYRKIFESVQDIYYETRTDGTIIDLSPSIEQISKGQYKREDLIGKSILGIYANPDDRNIYISKLFKLGNITDYELSFQNKDGSIVPVAVSSRLFFDADGNPATISGSMRDITERKQTELVLKQSNQKWEAIIGASPDGIGIVSLEGKLQLASDKLATMYGYSILEKELFIGKSVFEFIDSTDHEKLIGNIRNLLNNEFNQTFSEYLSVRKDGSKFYTELNSSILYDNIGNPESIMYVQRDISSRKMAEESMRESEEKYRNIFVNAQEGIFQTNVDGSYRSVNPALAKIYGFESSEELMNNRSDISKDSYLDPNERENFLRLMKDQGFVKGYEYEVKRKDGSSIWLFEDAKAIKDKNGDIQYFEGFVVDITERKLAENALNDKKNLLTNLIINLQEGILLEDANRKIVLTNQLFCDMFGIPAPPEVMVGADCSGSAEDSKFFFKNPVKFITDINLVLEERKAVYNDELELADGRYFERDYIPTYLDNQYSGHLWKYRDISNRRQSEEGFKKISQAVEQSPIVNYITDLKGAIEYVNPKLLELTGYSREELIGNNPRIFSSGETSSEDYAKIYQTISSGLEWKGEFHNRRKNGTLFWVSALISPVTDSKGKITHFLAVEEDITERKEKDKEIQKLSHALEQSPVIIIMTDLNGNFEYVNPAFHAITGYRPDEIAGKSTRILKSGETDDEVYQDMWETISAGNDWYGEWLNKKKSGESYWVNVSVTPFRDDKGNITNYLAVEQDISTRKLAEKEIQDLNVNLELKIAERTFELAQTNENLLTEIDERKRVSEALSDSESNYRSVVENVNEVIFRTDADGLWLFLNKSWTEVTGFTVAESLGQLFVNYVHPDDRARNWELFEPLIKREKEYCRHQVRYLTKDGGFRWVEVFARLGLNEQNEITGTFGTLQDITERREAEAALAIEKQRLASIIEGTHVGTW